MINLKIETSNVIITNTNKAFEGTEYAEGDFKIEFNRMTSTESFKMLQDINKLSKIKNENEKIEENTRISNKLFLEKVVKWEGFGNGEDNKAFTCNEKNKQLIIDFKTDLSIYAVLAYQEKLFTDIDEKEDDKKK